ncbi:MAG TPA: sigma-54 dependent transcriptional regulator [Phycisphaerae bacterium]|nr:sigma-54 dependent transcriptional regulator [Phycisphaerae bacterium]
MDESAFVLIVEDETAHGEAMAEGLKRSNHICRVVPTGAEAVESMKQRPPDVVITDYRLGGGLDGMDVLRAAKREVPECEVILITAYGSEQLARDALSRDNPDRAYDYLIKPIDIDVLRDKVDRAGRQAITARQNRELRQQVDQAFSFEGIIGTSQALAREIKRVRRLARTKSTVLIFGESGTGKELIAQAIHTNSPRKNKPFKVANCAAFTETLLDSELFGHVKGAFTGAYASRKGMLEAADGGTLFLDEIGDMPLAMQAKLLRALENGEVMPVGSTEVHHVDVRFVAATHQDLAAKVEIGEFRQDLLYRLHAGGAIRIPPLRERREDIPLLVQHFIDRCNAENHTEVDGIAPEAMRKLTQYSWRGNVRELRNVVEQMCVETDRTTLGVEDLPDPVRGCTDIVPVGFPNLAGLSMADVEKLHIMNTLKMFGGNRDKTAKALKIGARTLYRKLNDYGLR